MKKNLRTIYFIELILFIFIIIFNIKLQSIKLLYAVTGLFVLTSIVMIIRFGFMKDNNYVKGYVNRIVIASLMAFLIIIYFLGIFVGFAKGYSLRQFDVLINGFVISTLTILSQELIRYIIARNSLDNKKAIIIYTILLIILNIIMQINLFNLHDREEIFVFLSTVVIPQIALQMLLSYLTYKVSLVPGIIYRLSVTLYVYILPFVPALGNYLTAVLNVLLPYIIYHFSTKTIKYAEKDKSYSRRVGSRMIAIPLICVLCVIVLLITGIFKYTMIAIGSNSMNPAYYRGDAVIFEKVDIDEIKIGEVIAFKKKGVVITHRVIKKTGKGENTIFRTKGDANNAADNFDINASEYLGRVEYIAKYIGYPTLWVREVIE